MRAATPILAKKRAAAPTLWTPAEITTIAWYDATVSASITESGGAVSQWNDIGTNANQHLVQGTGSAQPITGSRTLNSLNVIDFDGTNDQLSKTSFPIPSSGNVSFFMVAVVDAVLASGRCLYAVDATADFQLQSNSGDSFHGAIIATGIGTNTLAFSGGPFPGPSIYNCNFDYTGGIMNGYVDGTKRSSDGTYSTNLDTSQTLRVMTNRAANAFLNAACAEFVIIEDCSTTCRQLMEGYLAHKWGIQANLPGGHPYLSTPPYV